MASAMPDTHGGLDQAFRGLLAHHGVPGLSIAVFEGGALAWTRGWGIRRAGSRAPVTPATLFQAASISKPLAALAALRLVDSGLIALDEDINQRLVSWRLPARDGSHPRITLRQLLSHTGGVTVHGFAGYARDAAIPTLTQILDGEPPANSPAIRVDTVPGTRWRYAGGGYSVLQQILIDLTGEPFPDLMRALVLRPLAMRSSTYRQPLPAESWRSAATGHRTNGEPVDGGWRVYPEMAAAGLWTTPSDLAHFALAIGRAARGAAGGIVSAGLAAEMLRPQAPIGAAALPGMPAMGLGVMLGGAGAARCFGHSGANAGFQCRLLALDGGVRGVVIMTNSDAGATVIDDVYRVLARSYGWPRTAPGLS